MISFHHQKRGDSGVRLLGEPKKKNVWSKILIVVVILGIIVGYLSYLQDKKMNKMLEELDRKKMEQIDPIEIQNL